MNLLSVFERHHAMAMQAWRSTGKPKFLDWAALHWREIVRLCGPLH